jgi:hypothetical protein
MTTHDALSLLCYMQDSRGASCLLAWGVVACMLSWALSCFGITHQTWLSIPCDRIDSRTLQGRYPYRANLAMFCHSLATFGLASSNLPDGVMLPLLRGTRRVRVLWREVPSVMLVACPAHVRHAHVSGRPARVLPSRLPWLASCLLCTATWGKYRRLPGKRIYPQWDIDT